MNKIISFTVVSALSMMFAGCGAPTFQSHTPTKNYAKQHNLTNNDYQESEIICISDKPLTVEEKKDIFLSVSVRYHSDFSLQMCKNSLQNGLKYSPQNRNDHYVQYKRCEGKDLITSIAKTETDHLKRYSDKSYKIEFRHYKGIYDTSRTDKSILYGYLGFDERDNQTIVYVADGTNEEKYIERPSEMGFIKEGVHNYMKYHPGICKPF